VPAVRAPLRSRPAPGRTGDGPGPFLSRMLGPAGATARGPASVTPASRRLRAAAPQLLRFAAGFPFPAVSVIDRPLDSGLVRSVANWRVAQYAEPLSAGLIVHVQVPHSERGAQAKFTGVPTPVRRHTVRQGCRHRERTMRRGRPASLLVLGSSNQP
jgi:hypothetical protein